MLRMVQHWIYPDYCGYLDDTNIAHQGFEPLFIKQATGTNIPFPQGWKVADSKHGASKDFSLLRNLL